MNYIGLGDMNLKYVVHWLESKIFQGLEGKNVKTFRELHFLFPIFFAANSKVKVQFVSKMNEQGEAKCSNLCYDFHSFFKLYVCFISNLNLNVDDFQSKVIKRGR